MLAVLTLAEDAPPQERYVFKPSIGSSHTWAISKLADSVSGRRVLDIGAGGGAIGRLLRSQGAARVVAIEIDARARENLVNIYDEVHETIAPLQPASFDVILLLDVLEHMADPFAYMQKVERLLAPGGIALISVPNITHWSVRFPLFFLGRFEYASRGLLDRTHLQFFTRSRFTKLLGTATKSKIESMSSSIEPVELVLPQWAVENSLFRAIARLRVNIAQLLPGLMAYQHLGVIRKG